MAFLQSQPPREPFLHAPGSVLGLIAGLIAIHLVVTFLPVPDSVLVTYVFIPARYVDGAAPLDLIVPLFSHQLLHGSYFHLTVNCVWLLAFGPVVARRLGGLTFFVFFFLCGAAGALTELAFTWGSVAQMIGASGAISGLMGAAFRLMRWPDVPSGVRLVPILSRPLVMTSLTWLILNAIVGIAGFGLGANAGDVQIAWQAHMGGYLFGLLTVGLFDRLRRMTA
jgi:membrane associated rhomboid family serine protease